MALIGHRRLLVCQSPHAQPKLVQRLDDKTVSTLTQSQCEHTENWREFLWACCWALS